MQRIITQLYGRFVDVVAAGRKNVLSRAEVLKLADGRIYTADQALETKLVDRIGYMEDAIGGVKKSLGVAEARVVGGSALRAGRLVAVRTMASNARLDWIWFISMPGCGTCPVVDEPGLRTEPELARPADFHVRGKRQGRQQRDWRTGEYDGLLHSGFSREELVRERNAGMVAASTQ